MSTQEKIKVMQAYLDGKPLQYRHKQLRDSVWMDYNEGEPTWSFGACEYRVKPVDPAYVAYKAYCDNSEHVFPLSESQFKTLPSYNIWQAVAAAVRAIPE